MESDSSTWEESPKILVARETVNILTQAMHKIDENDFFSAHIMVGIALHRLENLQIDLANHLSTEKALRDMLKHS
jgi:hypothetical protein